MALERESLKARQVLIDFVQDGSLPAPGTLSEKLWIAKVKAALDLTFPADDPHEFFAKPVINAVNKLSNGGIVLEFDSAESALFIRERKEAFASNVGVGWTVKTRSWTVMLKFIPVTTNIEAEYVIDRICEDSRIARENLLSLKWMKDPERRNPGQKSASVIAKFSSPHVVNIAIKNGMVIAGRRIWPELLEQEPLRCLNCQLLGARHLAAECPYPPACGNCGHTHKTADCSVRNDPSKHRCINCKTAGHASWDRNCPDFQRRLRNKRDSRTDYKYVVTEDEWTWERRWKNGGNEGVVSARQSLRPFLHQEGHTDQRQSFQQPRPSQRETRLDDYTGFRQRRDNYGYYDSWAGENHGPWQ